MSHLLKLAAVAIAIALTAAIVGLVANDRGRAAQPARSVRYLLAPRPPAPVVAGGVRGLTVQVQAPRYRLRPAPNAVVEVRPRPSCHYVSWQTIRTGADTR